MVVSRAKPKESSQSISGTYDLSQGKKKAGIKRGRGIHTLRHAFATHLLSQGTDLYTISRLLGHTSIKTTVVYLHLIPERITNIKSPLDYLYENKGGPSDE